MKPCQYCQRMATRRIQAEEVEFNKFAAEGYSCSEHFEWLQKAMDERHFQVMSLSVNGFNPSGSAVVATSDDELEII